jgi:hypothetical protein
MGHRPEGVVRPQRRMNQRHHGLEKQSTATAHSPRIDSMSTETLTAFFGWCTVINSGVLMVSSVALLCGRRLITKIHSSMFGLDEATLASAYLQYLSQYKIITLTLNFAPYVALKILA